jgi:hypothetical protein
MRIKVDLEAHGGRDLCYELLCKQRLICWTCSLLVSYCLFWAVRSYVFVLLFWGKIV